LGYPARMTDVAPILHHYSSSPFSEKARLALGLKGARWRSLEVSWVMPRPYTTPLTGGYRRVPVMQVGADVYCDTQLIARELERRYPDPTLYPGGSEGLASMLGGWSDARFFQAAMMVTIGGMGDKLPDAFIRDRQAMAGSRFDIDKIRAGAPVMRDQLRAQADWIETQLADGRAFLLGDAPGWGDITAYFNLWFVRTGCPEAFGVVERLAKVPAWMDRIAAIGHGDHETVEGERALTEAREATPATGQRADPDEPNGLMPGNRVAVAADDYARERVVGELVASDAQSVAIRREDDQVGEVVVHFPRSGYVVTPA